MQSDEGRKLVDNIGDSIAALLKLAPPDPVELMEVDSCSRAAEAREEARIIEEAFGGPSEAVPSEMFKKAASALADARRQARKASGSPYPPAGQAGTAPAQAPAEPAANAADPAAPPAAPAKASSPAASG